jgi:hypothetical protein
MHRLRRADAMISDDDAVHVEGEERLWGAGTLDGRSGMGLVVDHLSR